VAFAFGGIHCIGWSFTFSSSIERTLWRVTSLSITGFPIIYQLFGMLGQVIDEYILDERFDDLFTVLAQMLAFLVYTLS